MKEQDKVKFILGIAAGIAFIIGFGIGVDLYESSSETNRQSLQRCRIDC